MANGTGVRSLADLPVQRAADPKTQAQACARYFNSGNAFDIRMPPVPNHTFTSEPLEALNPDTPTSLIECDLSGALEIEGPATTPLALVRYARIRAHESLSTHFVASGVVVYVIAGQGETECGAGHIAWSAGDAFVLPGGGEHRYRAGAHDVVLWIATNEPQLRFERLQAPAPGCAPTPIVHYPSDEIERQIDLIYEVGKAQHIAGFALILSSEQQEHSRNALPTLTAAMNSLPPGAAQRAHRHNSMALTLIVDGDACHSIVDGVRKDWSRWTTTVTPPVSVHSHHNEGARPARFFIVQDGGLYHYTRAMGFSFAD